MAIISNEVATGRRMKGAEGFMRFSPRPALRPAASATAAASATQLLQRVLTAAAEVVTVLPQAHERVGTGLCVGTVLLHVVGAELLQHGRHLGATTGASIACAARSPARLG